MKFENNMLVSETSAFPGSVGDSAAETSRYVVNSGDEPNLSPVLNNFFVESGEVRHPDLDGYVDEKGNSWGTDDFSVDQWLALWVACALYQHILAGRMFTRLCRKGLRVGDGSFINPIIFAAVKRGIRRHAWYWDLAFLFQALLFRLPYRVKDNLAGLEPMSESSADYLNWYVAGPLFAHRTQTFTWTMRLAMKVISKERMFGKIQHYYKAEPNSEFVVSLYEKSINEIWFLK